MINFLELSLLGRIEHSTKISSWMKEEKVYNCDGSLFNLRRKKHIKKTK